MITDSSFTEIKTRKIFGGFSRSYILRKGNYRFHLIREYGGTKLYGAYRIKDYIDYFYYKDLK